MEKPLKVNLHILSPVHIGCDDYYEPMGFKVDEKRKKLIEFDPIEFFTNLNESDRKDFAKICEKGTISSIIEIYKFISHREAKGREVEIPSKFLNHFKQVLSLPLNDERKVEKELNNFAIAKTAYNPQTHQPYIPGSSLKGSLRTAYLNYLANELKHRLDVEKPKELEEKLLGGSFEKDPFRFIKISDFRPLQQVETKIFYAINKKKVQSKFDARGPYQMVETIKQGTVFEGTINIEKPQMTVNEIKKDNLFKAANDFYKKILSDEEKVLKNIQINFSLDQKLNNFKDKIGKTAFFIRIGRHSGAEAVTIEGYRKIKITQGKGRPPKTGEKATTLWLCSEDKKGSSPLIPFGWAMLEVLEQ